MTSASVRAPMAKPLACKLGSERSKPLLLVLEDWHASLGKFALRSALPRRLKYAGATCGHRGWPDRTNNECMPTKLASQHIQRWACMSRSRSAGQQLSTVADAPSRLSRRRRGRQRACQTTCSCCNRAVHVTQGQCFGVTQGL